MTTTDRALYTAGALLSTIAGLILAVQDRIIAAGVWLCVAVLLLILCELGRRDR